MPSVRLRAFRHLFRCACRDDGAAPVTAFRSHVDDVIRRLDHIQVVLDDHDGIAALCQPSQNLNQLMHICEMKSRRGLIQDIDRLSGASSGSAPWQA